MLEWGGLGKDVWVAVLSFVDDIVTAGRIGIVNKSFGKLADQIIWKPMFDFFRLIVEVVYVDTLRSCRRFKFF